MSMGAFQRIDCPVIPYPLNIKVDSGDPFEFTARGDIVAARTFV